MSLKDRMDKATNEALVEDVYYNELKKSYKTDIKKVYNTDGVLETKLENDMLLLLLTELKYEYDLDTFMNQRKVLIQVIYYLKKFEKSGETIPNVVLVGDNKYLFSISTGPLLKYLNKENVNWETAPSKAYETNSEMHLELCKDDELVINVDEITDKYKFKDMVDFINGLAQSCDFKREITIANVTNIANYFINKVVKNADKQNYNDVMDSFWKTLLDDEGCYEHPKKSVIVLESKKIYKEKWVQDNKEIPINKRELDIFKKVYKLKYSYEEKKEFTAVVDRLKDDENRRREGAFFTPTI